MSSFAVASLIHTHLLSCCELQSFRGPSQQRLLTFFILLQTFPLPLLAIGPHFPFVSPASLRQQVLSINTQLSVIGVTIGSCRYNVKAVYGLQHLKYYQLPIHKYSHRHMHSVTCTETHTQHSLFILIRLYHR